MAGHMLGLGIAILLFPLEYIASFTNTLLSHTLEFGLGEIHSRDKSVWIQHSVAEQQKIHQQRNVREETNILSPSERET